MSNPTRLAEAKEAYTAEELEEQQKEFKLVSRLAWFHLLYNWKTREIMTVKSTREELTLPSLRDEWERLYYIQAELPVPVHSDMSTVKAIAVVMRDNDDQLDLVHRSLAYEFGRRLWSRAVACLPHVNPENPMNSRWVKDPHLDVKDTIQSFIVENHGKKLRVIVEEYTDEVQRDEGIRKELSAVQQRLTQLTEELGFAKDDVEDADGHLGAMHDGLDEAEALLKKEQTLCTTFAKQIVELQGKMETAKLDVAAARRERDERADAIETLKAQVAWHNEEHAKLTARTQGYEQLKERAEQADIMCAIYNGTPEIDDIRRTLGWTYGESNVATDQEQETKVQPPG